jgi:hypothetical protein
MLRSDVPDRCDVAASALFTRSSSMQTNSRRLIGAAAAAVFVLSAGSAQAQGKGHDKDKEHGKWQAHVEHREARDDHDHDRDRSVQNPNDPRYDQRIDPRYERDARHVPPGLAKKPGGMPPGQYKKLYRPNDGAMVLRDVFIRHGYPVTRMMTAGQSEYVYYRLPSGSIRRAIVSPGAERLSFSNVPSSLVQEVLARLY